MSITYDKRRDKYSVRITLDGKRRYLGSFPTEREAERVYDQEKIINDARKRFAELMKDFTLTNYDPPYMADDRVFKMRDIVRELGFLVERARVYIILAIFARRRK